MPDPKEKTLPEVLVEEDVCPKCLGELDTGWECNSCGYDARPLVDGGKYANDE